MAPDWCIENTGFGVYPSVLGVYWAEIGGVFGDFAPSLLKSVGNSFNSHAAAAISRYFTPRTTCFAHATPLTRCPKFGHTLLSPPCPKFGHLMPRCKFGHNFFLFSLAICECDSLLLPLIGVLKTVRVGEMGRGACVLGCFERGITAFFLSRTVFRPKSVENA